MKNCRPIAICALALLASIGSGCGQKDQNITNMSREDQEKAFKGDPNKIPPGVKAMLAQQSHPVPPAASTAPK